MDVFSADFYDLLRLTGDMAYEGAWRPAVEYLSSAVARQTAIRDYIDGERVPMRGASSRWRAHSRTAEAPERWTIENSVVLARSTGMRASLTSVERVV